MNTWQPMLTIGIVKSKVLYGFL